MRLMKRLCRSGEHDQDEIHCLYYLLQLVLLLLYCYYYYYYYYSLTIATNIHIIACILVFIVGANLVVTKRIRFLHFRCYLYTFH